MARMVSPAGEMDMKFLGIAGEKSQLVIRSKFGAWDSKIYLSPEELASFLGLMLNWSVIGLIISFPFVLLGQKLCKREKKSQTS